MVGFFYSAIFGVIDKKESVFETFVSSGQKGVCFSTMIFQGFREEHTFEKPC